MGRAILRLKRKGRRYDLPIEWRTGYDTDASVVVPPELRPEWVTAEQWAQFRLRSQSKLAPYPTLPFSVSADQLNRSATGFYAIAIEMVEWDVRWIVPPPYPQPPTLASGPGDVH